MCELLLRESIEELFLGKSLLDEFFLAREKRLLIASNLETLLGLLTCASVGSTEESESQSKMSLGNGLGPLVEVGGAPADEWRLAYSSPWKLREILISS